VTTGEAVHILIFSKDRACQLDSLLRSLAEHFRVPVAGVTVLYACSGERYREGYREVEAQEIVSGIRWHPEGDFAADFRSIVGEIGDRELLMMLVDDDILYRPFRGGGLLERLSAKHLFITLRADVSHGRYELPGFTCADGVREWRWNYRKGAPTPWSYPFSLDGNILRAGTVKRLTRRLDFGAPNTLEGSMHRARHAWWVKRIPLALAPLSGMLYNNPLNRVQREGETWHRDIAAAELNDRYLAGSRIDNGPLYAQAPGDVHFAVTPRYETFERRSGR
jgi:hypothetical protein